MFLEMKSILVIFCLEENHIFKNMPSPSEYWENEELPAVGYDWVREHLRNMNVHNPS